MNNRSLFLQYLLLVTMAWSPMSCTAFEHHHHPHHGGDTDRVEFCAVCAQAERDDDPITGTSELVVLLSVTSSQFPILAVAQHVEAVDTTYLARSPPLNA